VDGVLSMCLLVSLIVTIGTDSTAGDDGRLHCRCVRRSGCTTAKLVSGLSFWLVFAGSDGPFGSYATASRESRSHTGG
jgi:hypothetical protein